MNILYDFKINELISELRTQIDNGNCTEYGEPQAFIELENGRSIEVTLEQYELPEDEYYFSVRLHCSSKEFDNGEYHSTNGIIDQYAASSDEIEQVIPLLNMALRCNKSYPVSEAVTNTSKKQNKWEELFDSFLELTEFSLVKNDTYKTLFTDTELNYKEYQCGFWSLKDLQGGNLGNICGERFKTAGQIFDRLEIYVDDYIVRALQEIRMTDNIRIAGYEISDYLDWEEYIANRTLFPEESQGDIDYLDMICNHANEIDLNNCTFEYQYKDRNTTLSKKISLAEDRTIPLDSENFVNHKSKAR